MFNVVKRRGWYFLFSALVIVPGLISLMIPPALKPGIDFTSGSAFEVTFNTPITEAQVRTAMADLGHSEAIIQKLQSDTVFIRMKELQKGERESIEAALNQKVASVKSVSRVETVSAAVARETVRNAIIALVLAAVGILLYMTWAFRRVPDAHRYGTAAILALLHDILAVIGIFSILGKVLGTEVNAMFIVGLLAVAGYSVNDTIVVFDRIRENVARNIDQPLEIALNKSIWETAGRSLGTSLTTLLTLVALLLIGGSTIRDFLLVLTVGIAFGTYSSIFIAAQFLMIWEEGEIGKAWRFLRHPRLARARSA